MTVQAFAKINFGLQIVRKREDGYHDIDTVFHRVNIVDELSFSRRESGISLSTNDPSLPTDESNLCVKATKSLFDAADYDAGVHIELVKRIPYGAGLGGGSADAAATLTALHRIFDFQLDENALHRIASSIGADVAYFLSDGSAYAKGKGDVLSYFDLDLPYWILIVHPSIEVSTPWAYRNFTFNPSLPIVPLQQTILDNVHTPVVWVNKIRNDFEPVVFTAHNDVMRIKEILYRTGAEFALMSGSGSSVFGMFASQEYAEEASAFIAKRHATWLTPPGFGLRQENQ